LDFVIKKSKLDKEVKWVSCLENLRKEYRDELEKASKSGAETVEQKIRGSVELFRKMENFMLLYYSKGSSTAPTKIFTPQGAITVQGTSATPKTAITTQAGTPVRSATATPSSSEASTSSRCSVCSTACAREKESIEELQRKAYQEKAAAYRAMRQYYEHTLRKESARSFMDCLVEETLSPVSGAPGAEEVPDDFLARADID
jgi:hypothetical protein